MNAPDFLKSGIYLMLFLRSCVFILMKRLWPRRHLPFAAFLAVFFHPAYRLAQPLEPI
jgi:hypothetical protein